MLSRQQIEQYREEGYIVAVVVPTIANSVFAETVQGLSDAVKASGLQLLLGETSYELEAERALLRALVGRRPEGLVTVGLVRDRESRALLERLGTPVVETWDLSEAPLDQVVGFSNEAAGAAMRACFEAAGRRQAVFVGGPDERAAARRRGFGPATHISIAEPISYGAGRRAVRRLLEDHPRADAAFFATDVLAVGALLEAERLGIAVPERLAIGGLGDLEIAAELGLTTIRVPSYEIGQRAGERLIGRLRGEAPNSSVLDLGFELIRRRSA